MQSEHEQPVTQGVEAVPVRAAPPTMQGPMPVAHRVGRWVMPMGIILIVFGVGGILTSAWGLAQHSIMRTFMGGIAQDQPMLVAMKTWGPLMAVLSGIGVPVAAVLLWGGVLLVKRNAAARSVLLAWAGLRSVVGGAVAVVTGLMQRDQFEAMALAAGGATMFGGPAMFGGPTAVFVALLGLLWVLALPAAVVVWLMRRKIRAEIRGWHVPVPAR